MRGVRLFVLAALAGLAPVPALPGAWERPKGETFVALTYGADVGGAATSGQAAVYAEHGLGRRLTFGFKLDQRPQAPHAAEVFLRRNVEPEGAPIRIALSFGLSMPVDEAVLSTAAERTARTVAPSLSLHVGHGFDGALASGWADMRVGAVGPTDISEPRAELDAIVGLRIGERAFVTAEIWADFFEDRTFTTLTPGIGVRLSDRVRGTLRYIHPDAGPDRIEIGTWLEF